MTQQVRAALEKYDWLMDSQESFEDMVARASFENIPEPIRVEKTDEKTTVYLHGPIVKTHDIFSILEGGVSASEFESAIAEGQLGSEIDLDIDCGGGQALAAMPMVDAIRRSRVPVNAHITGVCASLGYMLACATGRPIVAHGRGTLIGSVGAMGMFDPERDKSVVRSENAQNKNSLADIQQRLNSWEGLFYEVVGEGRNITTAVIKETYGNGMAFIAEEALARGMIDSIQEAAPSATPITAQNTGEEQRMSDSNDGVVTLSTEEYNQRLQQERDLAKETAKAELMQEQEEARLEAKREADRLEAENALRRAKIENYAKEHNKEQAAAQFLSDKPEHKKFASMSYENVEIALSIAPVDEKESKFSAGASHPDNNPDVGSGARSVDEDTGEANYGSHWNDATYQMLRGNGMSHEDADARCKELMQAEKNHGLDFAPAMGE